MKTENDIKTTTLKCDVCLNEKETYLFITDKQRSEAMLLGSKICKDCLINMLFKREMRAHGDNINLKQTNEQLTKHISDLQMALKIIKNMGQ